MRSGSTTGLSALLTLLIGVGLVSVPASRVVYAATPVITIGATGVGVKVTDASLFDIVDALGRAAGFKVAYEGARPTRMLYAVDVTSASVPQALVRLLEGQNINYAMLLDRTGTKVTSLMIVGAVKTTATGATGVGAAARPRAFTPPRSPRVELPPVDDEPAEATPEEVPAPEPDPAASPDPAKGPARPEPPASPTPGFRNMPFGTRPPFSNPFGPRPTPSPSP